MEATLLQHQQQLAKEIRELIRLLDSTHWRDQLDNLRQRLDHVSTQIKRLLENMDVPDTSAAMTRVNEAKQRVGDARLRMRQAMQNLSEQVEGLRTQASQRASDLKQYWQGMRQQMAHTYENMASTLALQDIHVPHLRPTNYKRSIFHMCSGVVALVALQHTFSMFWLSLFMAGWLVLAIVLETGRAYSDSFNKFLMKFFGVLAHPHEHHRVNSATWYIVALFLLTLTVEPMMASLAVIILGFCDPAAAFVGRRWGRIQIYSGRTLEGTLTFVVTGIALSMAVMMIYYWGQLSWLKMLAIASAASVAGGLTELYSKRIDDNLSIPLAAGWTALLVSYLF
ncbi:MAG: hypothetical protein EP343_05915 [Deltaproteobacteria bacterium]|nr:MAG: hypothetical protein EP343_05915 [Deltaproteobacteria bacterium]